MKPPPSRLNRISRERAKRDPKGTKGAVYVEFLVVFWPIFTAFWILTQATGLYAGKLIVMHSAVTGARAAAVVIPDDPANYGGEKPPNQLTGKRKAAIERAVTIPTAANGSLGTPEVLFPNGTNYPPGSIVTVHVKVPYYCSLPIAKWFVCIGGTRILEAQASMPVHAATYEYP